jgi:hypothetical protein
MSEKLPPQQLAFLFNERMKGLSSIEDPVQYQLDCVQAAFDFAIEHHIDEEMAKQIIKQSKPDAYAAWCLFYGSMRLDKNDLQREYRQLGESPITVAALVRQNDELVNFMELGMDEEAVHMWYKAMFDNPSERTHNDLNTSIFDGDF